MLKNKSHMKRTVYKKKSLFRKRFENLLREKTRHEVTLRLGKNQSREENEI